MINHALLAGVSSRTTIPATEAEIQQSMREVAQLRSREKAARTTPGSTPATPAHRLCRRSSTSNLLDSSTRKIKKRRLSKEFDAAETQEHEHEADKAKTTSQPKTRTAVKARAKPKPKQSPKSKSTAGKARAKAKGKPRKPSSKGKSGHSHVDSTKPEKPSDPPKESDTMVVECLRRAKTSEIEPGECCTQRTSQNYQNYAACPGRKSPPEIRKAGKVAKYSCCIAH